VDEGSCVLWTGEELSRTCGLPDWAEYLKSLIHSLRTSRMITREQSDHFRQLWQSARFEQLATLIRTTVHRGDRHAAAYAREVYSRTVPESRILELLGAIPFCAAVTPNLDELLERGRGGRSGFTIWPDEAAATLRKSCAEAMRDLHSSRTMLAFGISPAEMQRWLEAAGVSRADTPHYLITMSCDPELERKAEILYRRFHVEVLATPDLESDEVLTFLQQLLPYPI
jgi:hypothetical protein